MNTYRDVDDLDKEINEWLINRKKINHDFDEEIDKHLKSLTEIVKDKKNS